MVFSGGFSDTHRWDDGDGGNGKRECCFVFIGKNLDKEKLLSGFMRCRAEETLRFGVGDSVRARSRTGWREGVVVKQWDEGNCYRIRLRDCPDGTTIWAPIDDDLCVKAAS